MSKKISFTKAEFLLSAPNKDFFPKGRLPEIAIIGRSNVGKSSLINALTNQKRLAITSSTPGRTRLINFFTIDDSLLLVDLPGYGFIKGGKKKRANLAEIINEYFGHSDRCILLLWLLDIRHKPSVDDLRFNEWLLNEELPFMPILTKADKLTKQKQNGMIKEISNSLQIDPLKFQPFSHREPQLIAALRSTLETHYNSFS